MNPTSTAPTADQLSAARLTHWHQDATPLLTIESLREWIARSGLVLYTSRAQQLPSPAPSLVEATLGTANSEPTMEAQASAKNLLARLIAEGSAVPLNLLGATGGTGTDVPDFVCSAAVFSFIFTLRGNKAWKQSPVTSGPVKVSPLALAAYEILSQKVTLSAYDLTTQLGKEVTEAAVLRSLTELWSQLRVLPIPQQDGSATLWELASARFTKQIKAGANAGQPTALSALISLYLGQAVCATEEEIETFLSPLAPRSRLRDVTHALLSARQLESLVIEGKTLLHVTGDTPKFVVPAAAAESEEAVSADPEAAVEGDPDAPRIRKFTPNPASKIGTGLRAKPSFGGNRPAFGARTGKPAFGSKAFGAGDRERRPFKRDDSRGARPSFNKPWDEERQARHGGEDRQARTPGSEGGASEQGTDAPRTFTPRPARPFGSRPSAGAGRPGGFQKRSFGPARDSEREGGPRKTLSKPGTFGRKREGGFDSKPSFDRGGDSRPPRRDFGDSPRSSFSDRGDRAERPAGGGFKRPGSSNARPSSGGRPSFGSKPGFSGPRPDRGDFASRKPFTPREGGSSDRPARPSFDRKPSFGARNEQSAGGEAPRKVFRKFDAPRGPKPFGSRPSFGGSRPASGDRGPRSGAEGRPASGGFARKPFTPHEGGSDRPARPYTPREGGSSDRPARPGFGDRKPSFGGKPGGGKSFGDRKPSSFAGKGGPFAKFADGKKPFRKPGPGKPSSGGFNPTRRQRPDSN